MTSYSSDLAVAAAPAAARRLSRSRVAGAALLALLTSCGATGVSSPATSDAPDASPTSAPVAGTAGTLTWGDGECSADVSGALAAGSNEFEVVNESDGTAAFHLWQLAPSTDYDEFVAFVDDAVEQIAAGDLDVPPPTFLSGLMASPDLQPGESETLDARLQSGTYVLVCLGATRRGEDAHIAAAAGPIEVAD